jgi:hypothetical protein
VDGIADHWHDWTLNAELLGRIRQSPSSNGRLFVFLGAGLSFGAARVGGRERFDQVRYPRPYFDDRPHGSGGADDGLPLPSWAELMRRMLRELEMSGEHDDRSLQRFFHDQGPLDCAQLFAQTVGPQRYRVFLQRQLTKEGTASSFRRRLIRRSWTWILP